MYLEVVYNSSFQHFNALETKTTPQQTRLANTLYAVQIFVECTCRIPLRIELCIKLRENGQVAVHQDVAVAVSNPDKDKKHKTKCGFLVL